MDDPHQKKTQQRKLKHNEVNLEVIFEGPRNYSKIALYRTEVV